MHPSTHPFYKKALVLSLLLTPFFLSAQMPVIKTDGKGSNLVRLQTLHVDVTITGSMALTTWTMTFKNTTSRILEGELTFPLPQGISISRYALDINGRLREAVPVEKEKGTRIFENVERRRVDPGLLEKVDGSGFRTRIYPINPNSTRTVLIGYEEDLPHDPDSPDLHYRLPLAFQHPIEEFGIDIKILRSSIRPVIEENMAGELQFEEWKDTWTAARQWKNYPANHSLVIRIPKTPGAEEVLMQQKGNHYFYSVNAFPRSKRVEKELPRRLTLLWDASLSGLSRDTKKELDLLDGYITRLKDVSITLVAFSNTVQDPQTFDIHNGDWQLLRTTLQKTVYDGGTRFGALNLERYPADEYLLFSDGRSNFGSSDIRLSGHPVYTITSTARSDFPFLRSIADRSGGECIDLEKVTAKEAKEQLLYQTLHFLGVRRADGLEESYPSLPIPVTGGITIAGISYRPQQDLVLQFGYGGKVTIEQTVSLDFTRQQTDQVNLPRIWAQKKIGELDARYDDNRTQIEGLGKRYGIITRNTSLIVLESVNDYVTYQIEPPAELREQYDRIIKQRGQEDRQRRETVASKAATYFNELLQWWNTDFSQAPRYHLDPGTRSDTTAGYLRPLQDRTAGIQADQERAAVPQRNTRNFTAPRTLADGNGQRAEEVVVSGFASRRKAALVDDEKVTASPENDPEGRFTAAGHEVRAEYLDKIKAAPEGDRYALYLQYRKEYRQTPLYYFNTANLFFASGKKDLGLRILSNIAELDAENYELYKLLGYRLKQLGETEAALSVFRKVLEWRPFEPQSYRDYGLALADAGHYQAALDTLYTALVRNYDKEMDGLYEGVEETILPELNDLITLHKGKLNIGRIPKTLLMDIPVDIRVVLNWNMNNTDIDLWVTDPDSEKCYYSHRNTAIGGRISHDFTRGLGPEQFLLKKAVSGKYKVEVNYYGDTQVKLAGPTTIMVEVYTHYGTSRQNRQIITMQMQETSQGTVFVGEFEF